MNTSTIPNLWERFERKQEFTSYCQENELYAILNLVEQELKSLNYFTDVTYNSVSYICEALNHEYNFFSLLFKS